MADDDEQLLIGVYVGVVAGVTLLVPSNAQRSVSVAAAIVVAFLFAPVRSLVQRLISRAFYGTRSDPARTAWQIGEGLPHDDDLPGVLEQTRSALRLPSISLRGEPDGNLIATAGTPQGTPSAELPLTYRDEPVGTMIVGLRRGERRTELRGAIDDVRRVVYGLRPIELDNAGLVGAIGQRLAGLPSGESGQITVEMESPEKLPALSPAVELAAYRIASEAITNALTHSEGRHCLVTITANGTLGVTVRDDGRPPTSWTPGIGLRSRAIGPRLSDGCHPSRTTNPLT